MNEKTLNNTTTVRGDQHIGGFVLVERVDRRHWRAYEWSAFFARMVLPFGCCKSFLDNDGRAVTELSVYKVMELSNRFDTTGEQSHDKMVFIVPENLAVAQQIYNRWKESLTAEPIPECHEQRYTVKR